MSLIVKTCIRLALGLGSCVNGVSNVELKLSREVLFCATPPIARGSSMTSIHEVIGDPSFSMMFAPIWAWVREVWRASCVVKGPHCSILELQRLWHEAGPRSKRTWHTLKGPLGAMWLSLKRLGWEALDPFNLVDDTGMKILLTANCPRMVSCWLWDSIQRMHERALGVKLQTLAGDGDVRAWVGAVQSATAP